MPDGRKNNRGTPGNKGGRKPKADEITMIQNMDATKAPAEVWQALAARVDMGDTIAIKTWLSYRYGQPKQTVDHQSSDGSMSPPRTLADIYEDDAESQPES